MIRGKYYNSIHNCPILIWNQAMSTGSVQKLHRSGIYSGKKAKAAWEQIFDEYIKEFGLPSNYNRYLKMMTKAMDELAKSYTTTKWLRPIAQIREAEAKLLLQTVPSSAFSDTIAKLSKSLGFQIDPSKTTVAQFYGYVNTISNGS